MKKLLVPVKGPWRRIIRWINIQNLRNVSTISDFFYWISNSWYCWNNETFEFNILSQLGFPFAKLLRNFCGTNHIIFLSLRISFCAKKTTICAIIRKSHFVQNCPIPLLRNSSFAQFRNFVKIKWLVTVCVSYNSILEKSCLGMSSYWPLLHNWPMTVKKSSNLTIFWTILVLDMHIS